MRMRTKSSDVRAACKTCAVVIRASNIASANIKGDIKG